MINGIVRVQNGEYSEHVRLAECWLATDEKAVFVRLDSTDNLLLFIHKHTLCLQYLGNDNCEQVVELFDYEGDH